MIKPKGILDLPRREDEVGIALIVDRWYEGSALACGERDMHEFGGSLTSGGGLCSSRGSGGDVSRLVV